MIGRLGLTARSGMKSAQPKANRTSNHRLFDFRLCARTSASDPGIEILGSDNPSLVTLREGVPAARTQRFLIASNGFHDIKPEKK
jgi:hypothetical protein